MATFKKIGKADMSTYKVTLVPMLRDDKTIAGRVTAIVIGDCGSLDVRSTVPDDPSISEAFEQASGFAGADGIVGVYDPEELWAPEWPPLA